MSGDQEDNVITLPQKENHNHSQLCEVVFDALWGHISDAEYNYTIVEALGALEVVKSRFLSITEYMDQD